MVTEADVLRAREIVGDDVVAHFDELDSNLIVGALIIRIADELAAVRDRPVPMILFCPSCGTQHVDAPDERTPDWDNPAHRSHLCHDCGHTWRPADAHTDGVAAIATRGQRDSPEILYPSRAGQEYYARLVDEVAEEFGAQSAVAAEQGNDATLLKREGALAGSARIRAC